MNRPVILFAAGGTGGHVYPALAVAKEVDAAGFEPVFIGSSERLEAELIPKTGYRFFGLPVRTVPRRLNRALLDAIVRMGQSFSQSRQIVKELQPVVTVGAGNYISIPPLLAARFSRVPLLLMEQNFAIGTANRLLLPFSRIITVPFEASRTGLPPEKAILTGNPIRPEFLTIGDERPSFVDHPTLLVVGGSLGAQAINDALVAALPRLLSETNWRIIHITGTRYYDEIAAKTTDVKNDRYELYAYRDDVSQLMARSNVALSRAGSAVFEFAACGIPMILVPSPYGGGHQRATQGNAQQMVAGGAGILLPESELSGDRLFQLLSELHQNPTRWEEMQRACRAIARPDAARAIARLIVNLANRH